MARRWRLTQQLQLRLALALVLQITFELFTGLWRGVLLCLCLFQEAVLGGLMRPEETRPHLHWQLMRQAPTRVSPLTLPVAMSAPPLHAPP